jgi:hypothetical protein
MKRLSAKKDQERRRRGPSRKSFLKKKMKRLQAKKVTRYLFFIALFLFFEVGFDEVF